MNMNAIVVSNQGSIGLRNLHRSTNVGRYSSGIDTFAAFDLF